MNHTSFKIAAAALAVASALSSTAYAGGFQLTEQSALALGRAYAGVGVDGTDVSGMYYNAATMTLHPGTQVQFGRRWCWSQPRICSQRWRKKQWSC